MGYNDALEIKANREIINSIFNPIKQAYLSTLSSNILSKYENFFLRYKILRISYNGLGMIQAYGKGGPDLTQEDLELLPRIQEVFSAIEMLIANQKTPLIKTKLMSGWYIQIGNSFFLISDKIFSSDGMEYSYYIQPIKKKLGKTASVLMPSNVLLTRKGGSTKI